MTNRAIVLVENGVVVAPGYMFSADQGSTAARGVNKVNTKAEHGHMRLSFSNAEVRLV